MFEWLITLPEYLQAFIVLGIFIIAGLLIYVIIKTSINIDVKNGKFSFLSKSHKGIINFEFLVDFIYDTVKQIVKFAINESTEKQMKVVQRKLTILETDIKKMYYKLLKESGIEHSKLTMNEDNQYFKLIVKNMLYSDDENGPKSTKSILRSYITSETYIEKKDNEIDSYIEEIYKIIFNNWNSILDDDYTSEIITNKGDTRQRVVSNEMIYDAFNNEKSNFIKLLKDLFIEIKSLKEEIATKEMQMKVEMKNRITEIYIGEKKNET
jgi:hypothetical protein